jgi:hypothetical protein
MSKNGEVLATQMLPEVLAKVVNKPLVYPTVARNSRNKRKFQFTLSRHDYTATFPPETSKDHVYLPKSENVPS